MIRILLTCIFCKRHSNIQQDIEEQLLPKEGFFVGCKECKRKIRVYVPPSLAVTYLLDDGKFYPYLSITIQKL